MQVCCAAGCTSEGILSGTCKSPCDRDDYIENGEVSQQRHLPDDICPPRQQVPWGCGGEQREKASCLGHLQAHGKTPLEVTLEVMYALLM